MGIINWHKWIEMNKRKYLVDSPRQINREWIMNKYINEMVWFVIELRKFNESLHEFIIPLLRSALSRPHRMKMNWLDFLLGDSLTG